MFEFGELLSTMFVIVAAQAPSVPADHPKLLRPMLFDLPWKPAHARIESKLKCPHPRTAA
eukprot:5147684-Pyramimonas_sp.AAC.1